MLSERTLFGERNKVELSLARIKEFEPMALRLDPAGYYVCVSGGKDSSVIQELCLMAGVRCEFVHNHTSVDHPETVRFVRREKARLENMGRVFRIEIPRFADGRQKTMWNLIERRGLPLRTIRWRCDELKEGGGEGRHIMTGVRWEESPRRRRERALHEVKSRKKEGRVVLNNDNDMRRRMSELCARKRSFVLNPIVDWTESEVWEFIKSRGVPFNPLYDMGYKRVGCVGCPMNSKVKKELDSQPKYKAAYFRAVEKHVARRRRTGMECGGGWGTAEEYFEWWLKGRHSDVGQKELIGDET